MSEKRKAHRAAKTTIVGGQPPGNDRDLATVPVGLEELLGMAAVDDAFAEALMADPDPAVKASGVTLTITEWAILRALDRSALEPMIARVAGSLPEPDRRAFLEQAATAVVVLVGGGAALGAAGCKDDGGSSAEKKKPKGRKPTPREAADTGARPDRPPERSDAGVRTMGQPRPPMLIKRPTRGIRPRRPPHIHDTRTTGISPDRPRLRKPSGDKKSD